MSDKIAEICARHAADANDAAVLHPELSPTWALAGWRAHDDRGYLLAECERLQGLLRTLSRDMSEEIESLTRQKKATAWIASAGAAQHRAKIEQLTRERDEARAVVSTLEIVGKAADDKLARMQEEIERLHKAHETACLGGSHD